MKRTALVLMAFLVAAPVFAATVDGRWSGSLETPNGAVEKGKVAALEIAMMGEAGGMPFEFVVKKSE